MGFAILHKANLLKWEIENITHRIKIKKTFGKKARKIYMLSILPVQ